MLIVEAGERGLGRGGGQYSRRAVGGGWVMPLLMPLHYPSLSLPWLEGFLSSLPSDMYSTFQGR